MPISSRFLRKLGFVKKKGVTQLTVRLEAWTWVSDWAQNTAQQRKSTDTPENGV